MTITVYGPGCAKCKQAEQVAREALAQAGVEAEVTKVEDLAEMARAGVLMTPALAIDGEIVVSGKVPTVGQVVAHVQHALR
jgi:small redox-active disulfide protein 2